MKADGEDVGTGKQGEGRSFEEEGAFDGGIGDAAGGEGIKGDGVHLRHALAPNEFAIEIDDGTVVHQE